MRVTEQVSQGGCGVSILGDTRKPSLPSSAILRDSGFCYPEAGQTAESLQQVKEQILADLCTPQLCCFLNGLALEQNRSIFRK